MNYHYLVKDYQNKKIHENKIPRIINLVKVFNTLYWLLTIKYGIGKVKKTKKIICYLHFISYYMLLFKYNYGL